MKYTLTGGAVEMGRALGILMDTGVEEIEIIHRSDGRYTAAWEDKGNELQGLRDPAHGDPV